MKRTLLTLISCFLVGLCSFAQSITFGGLTEVKPLKRGNTYRLTWSGGVNNAPIRIQLLNGNREQEVWTGIFNDGEAEVQLPKKLKPADGYYFRISQPVARMSALTPSFAVRPRVPRLLKVLGIAAIPVALLIVARPHRDPTYYGSPMAPPPFPGN